MTGGEALLITLSNSQEGLAMFRGPAVDVSGTWHATGLSSQTALGFGRCVYGKPRQSKCILHLVIKTPRHVVG